MVKASEKEFIEELNLFRNEVISALKFLYIELAIHELIRKDKKILDALNVSPTFWNTILNALQHSTFITFGRIFDSDPKKHTIHSLIRMVESNKELFSEESFKERWLRSSDRSKIDTWLEKYLETLFVPTDKDFRALKKHVAEQKKIYLQIYAPIRHHFGHKIYSKNEDVKLLFDKIQIKDLEQFCVRLYHIHEALWQLYHNGRGPLVSLKKKQYSTRNILKSKYEPYDIKPLNAQFVSETKLALNLLKLGKYPRNSKL